MSELTLAVWLGGAVAHGAMLLAPSGTRFAVWQVVLLALAWPFSIGICYARTTRRGRR